MLTHSDTPMTTWMSPEDQMLSEIRYSQKGKIPFDAADMRYLKVKIMETESRVVATRNWREGKLVLNRYSFSFAR